MVEAIGMEVATVAQATVTVAQAMVMAMAMAGMAMALAMVTLAMAMDMDTLVATTITSQFHPIRNIRTNIIMVID